MHRCWGLCSAVHRQRGPAAAPAARPAHSTAGCHCAPTKRRCGGHSICQHAAHQGASHPHSCTAGPALASCCRRCCRPTPWTSPSSPTSGPARGRPSGWTPCCSSAPFRQVALRHAAGFCRCSVAGSLPVGTAACIPHEVDAGARWKVPLRLHCPLPPACSAAPDRQRQHAGSGGLPKFGAACGDGDRPAGGRQRAARAVCVSGSWARCSLILVLWVWVVQGSSGECLGGCQRSATAARLENG